MAATIDATPGGANSNSFATVEYADAYNDTVLDGAAWASFTPDQKTRYLITATRLIVQTIRAWQGYPTSRTQRLPVPRTGMYTLNGVLIPSGVIPTELADATSELARRLGEDGMPDTSPEPGLKRLKAGPVDLEFDLPPSGSPSIDLPDAVLQMFDFLVVRSPMNRTVVPLIRG